MKASWLLALLLVLPVPAAEPLPLRVVAANLTSDNRQTYSPDNGNHSNPEGAGARILKALRPDLVLIQEFNTSIPARQWVNATFGKSFSFAREQGAGIPNGIISRHPILASGEWDDPDLDNRDFAWARIGLPGERELWAVSVHLHAGKPSIRRRQAAVLLDRIRKHVPAGEMLVVGGDLNLRSEDEACLELLGSLLQLPDTPPCDQAGNPNTNSPRNRPYDWVLANPALHARAAPVRFGGHDFPHGLVLDTRVFQPAAALAPATRNDSALAQMQHMAVVRDFLLK